MAVLMSGICLPAHGKTNRKALFILLKQRGSVQYAVACHAVNLAGPGPRAPPRQRVQNKGVCFDGESKAVGGNLESRRNHSDKGLFATDWPCRFTLLRQVFQKARGHLTDRRGMTY